MDLAQLQPIYNACNPDEALEPGDPRNVDLDAEYEGEDSLRGGRWAAQMERQVRLSGKRPVCRYFTGLRGSGKSTELRRLARSLRREDGAHLLPVLVDAEEMLDLSESIDVPDILVSLVWGVEREVARAEGRELRDGESYPARLLKWLRKPEVNRRDADLALDSAPLVHEMRDRASVRKTVREILAENLSGFLSGVHDELLLLEDRARACGYAGLVVIYDSLEKLQGISSNWSQVLESAERVFSGEARYLQLPVHVLYTVPPAIALRLRLDVSYLPMIKLSLREGGDFEPGYEAARAIVRKRIPDAVLDALLGEATREEKVRDLIRWSGGYPREIVRLLQAMLEAENVNTDRGFARLLNRAGDDYRRVVLASGALGWLEQVAREQSLRLETDADRAHADRMLATNVVLRYLNDTEWFDLHPAVYEIPALERARAERPRTR